ncbi:MAG TPA: CopD family protein [Lysobacter sp.]
MAYFWIKTAHLVFVIAWMAAVFYLPRILVNIAEAGDVAVVRDRLVLMGRRLYRFGHMMFGFAFVLGLLLALGGKLIAGLPVWFAPGNGWLHAKIALVIALVAFFSVTGRWLKRAGAGGPLPSARALRFFNEIPVLLLVAIVFLVLAKPF